MSQRDSGWIQLYAQSNQDAADLHIIAFRLAEELSIPVMVCMDGFVLTHAVEEVDVPEPEQVDAYLPAFAPWQMLDPQDPVSIGAMVGPEAFMEVKYLAHQRQLQALTRLPQLADEFETTFGRRCGDLVNEYRTADAEVIVVALGSAIGTVQDTIDELRVSGMRAGVLGITAMRPFPFAAVRAALAMARRVVVIDRALAMGSGGIVAGEVGQALRDLPVRVHPVIAGLGGRPITRASLKSLLADAVADRLTELTFLDLDVSQIPADAYAMAAHRLES
jgi:pyruvate ferredoxin oxidoreductase alpha subunit